MEESLKPLVKRTRHAEEFKRLAVAKYLNRGGRTVTTISQELGIAPSHLYEWVNKYSNSGVTMAKDRSPQNIPALEKFNLVLQYERLEESARGEFLRTKGITDQHIEEWKEQMAEGLGVKKSSEAELKQKVKVLEKEVNRKDKALAETAALLVMLKKIQKLGDSEDES